MKVIDSIRERLNHYKFMIMSQYQYGAELGKDMKKRHNDKLKEIKNGKRKG